MLEEILLWILKRMALFYFVCIVGAMAANNCPAQDESVPAVSLPENNHSKIVSLNFRDTDLREVLNILAYKGGVNILAGEDVDVRINVNLKDVYWEKALDVILKTYNFTYKKEGELIRVLSLQRALDEENKMPLQTKIIPLNFANVENLRMSLSKVLSRRGSINIDARTNSLIVTDIPDIINTVAKAADDLDTHTPQVLIEAMMVDVKVTDEDKWGSLLTILDRSTSNLYNHNLANTGSTGTFSFASVFDGLDINGIIDIWQHQNKAQILANPKVLTLDHQLARIEIIEEIPYYETVDSGSGTTTNVKFKQAGVKLFVTPHITSEDYISMNVMPEQSFKSDEALGQPIIDTRRAETNLLVKDGQTIVIGGLRKMNYTDLYDKIPLLGDIPFLGLFFKKKVVTKVETELVLFITPHIISEPLMSDQDLKKFEQLENIESLKIDDRTEKERFDDLLKTLKGKLKARKIAEFEAFKYVREQNNEQNKKAIEQDDLSKVKGSAKKNIPSAKKNLVIEAAKQKKSTSVKKEAVVDSSDLKEIKAKNVEETPVLKQKKYNFSVGKQTRKMEIEASGLRQALDKM